MNFSEFIDANVTYATIDRKLLLVTCSFYPHKTSEVGCHDRQRHTSKFNF